MAAKIWKRETIETCLEIEGTLDKAIAELEEYKRDHPDHKNFMIEKDGDYEDWYYILTAERLETETEFIKRMKRLESSKRAKMTAKEKKEERERAEYERLKTIYGKLERAGSQLNGSEPPPLKRKVPGSNPCELSMIKSEDVKKVIAEISSLTKISAGKMSKSDNYEMVEYVQLDQVLKVIKDNEETKGIHQSF